MKVAIIGTGHVGLTTGVCLAHLGHTVYCVDNDAQKIKSLQKGISPIFESGINELLKANLKNKRLIFSNQIPPAVKEAEIIFICVNTPQKKDGRLDLKYIEQVTKEIAQSVNDGNAYKVIVDKSTVPVQTAEKVRETIARYSKSHATFDVVSNPEFLKEGTAIKDTLEPDRIVIGVDSEKAKTKMLELYKPLIEKSRAPLKIVSVKSAELIKHGANMFLTMKISFANLIAYVCEETGADAFEVLEAIGLDARIGEGFLKPGIGFGGSCFPKDIAAFKKTLEELSIDSSLIESIERANELAWQRFINKIEKELWVLDGKIIGILGLAFKPNTDDLRNAPALKIINALKEKGAKIKAYDPQAMKKAEKLIPDIQYCKNPYLAAKSSEALLICTEWEEFKNLDFKKIRENMAVPIIFDGRNVCDAKRLKDLGFKYFAVGR